MADQQDESQEKTEEPTARRLSKAREEGQIARSTEITIAASVISVAIYIYLFGSSLLGNVANIFAKGLVFDSLAVLEPQVAAGRLADAMIEALFTILPILILTGVVVLACSGLIGGYNFSWKSLQPKASKFNPIAGLKRMFGMQALVNLGKSIAKFLLVGGVTYFLIDASIMEFAEISLMALEPGLTASASILTTAFLVASSTLIIIALIDAPYQVYQHNQKMKMSLKEVKDERKDTEGSPEVKQRIRQKQREVSAARMLEAIAEADVVITNPEHFAVALAYDPSSEDPPKVVAKGADLMAERIRERAGEEGVPLFQSPVLARALFFTTEIEAFIPEPLFEAVAQVIAYIFNINSINRSSSLRDKPVPRVPDNMVFDSEGRQSEVYDQ
ncbi:MAG: flagellar biosynthesis protein FlhB [Cellvibrionales bacterium TMED122]|nr:flagellar biosynthesis protein FlhB [Halieaceae bacterium]OUV69241.1 MAG: flagellar biosynthesis protein FlhB [Cellvibrionales bacterium TMED122]